MRSDPGQTADPSTSLRSGRDDASFVNRGFADPDKQQIPPLRCAPVGMTDYFNNVGMTDYFDSFGDGG
jgi:hypothetical protein